MNITIYRAVRMFCITSDIFKEDFDLIKKYDSEKLTLKNENGEQVFSIKYDENRPCVDKYGIVFNGVDSLGHLTASIAYPSDIEDVKKYVSEYVFAAAEKLKKLEEQVIVAAADVETKLCSIEDGMIEA